MFIMLMSQCPANPNKLDYNKGSINKNGDENPNNMHCCSRKPNELLVSIHCCRQQLLGGLRDP